MTESAQLLGILGGVVCFVAWLCERIKAHGLDRDD